MVSACEDVAEKFLQLRHLRCDLARSNELGEPDNRVERCPELVRHVREEFALQPTGRLDLLVLGFELDALDPHLLAAALVRLIAKDEDHSADGPLWISNRRTAICDGP